MIIEDELLRTLDIFLPDDSVIPFALWFMVPDLPTLDEVQAMDAEHRELVRSKIMKEITVI